MEKVVEAVTGKMDVETVTTILLPLADNLPNLDDHYGMAG